MFKFMNEHFYFGINPVIILTLLTAIILIPCALFLPEPYGYENGLIETIQMIVLFIGFYISLTTKDNKKLFKFCALVITIILLREVNCGRMLFFAVPGRVNTFYSWKEIKYGYLAHPIFGLYILCVAIYFLKNKLYLDIWKIAKHTTFPFWNVLLMFIGMVLAIYTEKYTDSVVYEECAELLFYTSLVSVIWMYSRDKNFIPKIQR